MPFLMNKTLVQFLTIFLFAWGTMLHNAQAQSPFITRWDLSKTGGAATTLSFSVVTAGTVSYTWQQVGGPAFGSSMFSGSTLTITGLPSNAIIDVSIAPSNFQRIVINYGTNRQRLTEIRQWGTVAWTSMQDAFNGCSNMALTATDTPNFAAVTSMRYMFESCSSFNQSLSNFNTAAVTDMSYMFRGCFAFNQSLSNLNTAAVKDMREMFFNCSSFNQSISNFNTANVTDMGQMFAYCRAFNQSISNFNTAKVTNMYGMFYDCRSFNQSVSNFNTAAVTDMNRMFAGCSSFNQSVNNFNTAKVTDMDLMFSDCRAFNQSLSNFNTEAVTSMSGMFWGCYAFNQSVSNFNTAKVSRMSWMFADCSVFNQSVSNFNTASVTKMDYMFSGCRVFNQSVSNFNTAAVTEMDWMFYDCRVFNQSVSNFNTAAVIDMSFMFSDCTAFNQPVSNFNTAAVTSMRSMFDGCSVFNQSVSNFNIAAVTNVSYMFAQCNAFNQTLASWGSQLNANVDLSGLLNDCGMSVVNYDATLKAFAAGSVTRRIMAAYSLKYCSAEAARTLLTTPTALGGKGWTISGDTKNCVIQNVITISPERSAICPGASITMNASGCAGTLTWIGGPSPQTGSSVTLRPAVTTSYSANCSTGGSETFTVKVATNTVAVGYNVVTEKERFKAVTTLTSDKKVGNINFTPGANVIYEAGSAITLLPGFTAEKSSTFLAEIKTCP
ncbi:MAG: BspA family leucine-rich repeat surface protein [Runella slithyformis]|nr:MAG: BspA family leucine-rich repeat surface protein [Runella slithyformis]TAF26308.1 MAG: BspA family leucine-rich repeat surface protein [Runella slithyformis]TAF44924.1 MAG: BspA family leucine-rich repeat surface protein [Runella slithyformis]TAF80404.1 MAG: BspA family leucine-rich repeat surface protein [Runella slithyformis]